MVIPKDGKIECKKCNYTSVASGEVQKFTTDAKSKQTIVQSDTDALLPKVRVVCPTCGYTEATVTVRQTRAADEPETMIYRCCNPNCNHTWREY